MIAFLSPAKNMWDATALRDGTQNPAAVRIAAVLSRIPDASKTLPIFWEEALSLSQLLKTLSPWQLETILEVNPQLALKAFEQLQRFDPHAGEIPALLAYYGLQYQHLAAWDFTASDFMSAQQRLRIVSGLYGILRPLDRIMPYRLEMQCKMDFYGKRLYRYWGSRLCQQLLMEDETLINLASKEYAKAILPYAPAEKIITCDFFVEKPIPKGGKRLRSIPTASKMARGEMARFLVKNRLQQPEQLQAFDWQGFRFIPALSDNTHYVFTREDLPFTENNRDERNSVKIP